MRYSCLDAIPVILGELSLIPVHIFQGVKTKLTTFKYMFSTEFISQE